MPTHEERPEFRQDFDALTREQQLAFLAVLRRFIADLRRGQFRAGLRVKRAQGYPGVRERTWAPGARATFQYGAERQPGEQHVICRRIGAHGIFRAP